MPYRRLPSVLPLLSAPLALAGLCALLALLLLPARGAAATVEGSGEEIEQPRALAPFSEVVVEGPLDVVLRQGSCCRALVHADDNIAPLVRTEVGGERLVVGVVPGSAFRSRSRLRVTVEFGALRALTLLGAGDARAARIAAPILEVTLRGAGDLRIDELQAESLAVSISGSGDFTAAGSADKLGAALVGRGDLRAENLRARAVAVWIRGSGDARVDAAETLAVDIAGSGDVRYRGSPAVTQKIKGSGAVAPLR